MKFVLVLLALLSIVCAQIEPPYGGITDPSCAAVTCLTGSDCVNGRCVQRRPFDPRCAAILCPIDTTCVYGRCVKNTPTDPSCAAVLCQVGTTCVKGECISNSKRCKVATQCARPESCIDGFCFNRCKTTKCRGGDVCIHGVCVPQQKKCRRSNQCQPGEICSNMRCIDKCSLKTCRPGYYCQNGNCIKQNNNVPAPKVCPKNSPAPKFCRKPRPNQSNCQGMAYIQTPAARYCGVRADGSRQNFIRQCQACKDQSIVFYFDKPCHTAPFVCEQDQQCNDYYCSKRGCKSDQECPYDWQICLQGKCIDGCARFRCAGPNPCKFGQCNYVQPYGTCSVLRGIQCPNNWICVGECIQRCTRTRCPPNFNCDNGECQPANNGPY